jgi:GNAT superfamily N-acetyltransferase
MRVVTWTLEMLDPAALRPSGPPRLEGVDVRRAEIPSPELSRFLYTAVGGEWYWLDRLLWSYQRWEEWLDRPQVETWVAYVRGTPAGYFELEVQVPESDPDWRGAASSGPGAEPRGRQVELAYFGLLPRFIGGGLGGWLLTIAVRRAWELGPWRVWMHTCTLDGPHALSNYRARGFQVCAEREDDVDVLPQPIGPWPGAGER